MRKKQAGEIVYLLTLGSLIIITITSIALSAVFKQRQIIKAKAEGDAASLSCIQNANGKDYIFFKRSDASPVCDPNEIKNDSQNDAWLVGEGRCENNNACGSGKWCYYFDNNYNNSRCLTRDPSCDNGSCLEDGGGSLTPTPGSGGGGGGGGGSQSDCFYLTGETYANKESSGFKFDTYLKVHSPEGGKDGHIQLWVNGNSKGWNQAWNKNVNNPFVINPEYLDSPTVTGGSSKTMKYKVKVDECSPLPNEQTLTCVMSVTNGAPFVSGCECKNCGQYQPAATNTPKPSPTKAAGSQPPSTPNPGEAGGGCESNNMPSNSGLVFDPTSGLSVPLASKFLGIVNIYNVTVHLSGISFGSTYVSLNVDIQPAGSYAYDYSSLCSNRSVISTTKISYYYYYLPYNKGEFIISTQLSCDSRNKFIFIK